MRHGKDKRNRKNVTVSRDGYIRRFFGTDIGRILVPNNRSYQNCETPYVPHPEAECRLRDCLIGDPIKDKSFVFTGLTGSGKTTILRHVFGLEENACTSRIKDNTLIISVDFNRPQKSAQDAILSSLRSAIQMIADTYEEDYPDIYNEKFFEYIYRRREDFLFLNAKHGKLTPHSERMEEFLKEMPTEFASCQLQYLMDQQECQLKLVVLIVDNIEAYINSNAKEPGKRYLSPVIYAFMLADCIEQRGDSTSWCFNMVIACRHHIWRIMKGEYRHDSPETAILQSYVATETPYDLAEPIEVYSIIKKREEVLSKRMKEDNQWNDAVTVVNTVFERMKSSIGNFVMQLELKDLRKSMSLMYELILHNGLQRKSDEEIEGAFQIDSVEQFDLTRVNLVKTIGLGNNKYYSDSNSVIPNLLYNEQADGMELYVLLTLKYFLIQCNFREPTWDRAISIPVFKDRMRFIFKYDDRELEDLFGRSLQYLLQNRLLLRSADQPQHEVPGLSLEDIKDIAFVYVSGAAVKLWEELGKSSALFQLFLDDIWLDEESDFFDEDGNDIEHCVKYLMELQKIEKRRYNEVENLSYRSKKAYLEAFGNAPICKQLVNGLIASLEAISTSGYLQSPSRINTAKETLKKAKILLEELQKWEREREREKV